MDLGADIYKISELVSNIQKKYMEDIDEDTLTMGIYGYMNEVYSTNLQNNIIMASEWGNEAFPLRAKFEKTILTNAITYNITDINATPAKMTVMIGFIEKELQEKMINSKYVINRENRIMIGDYEFHLDYDVIITKSTLVDGTTAYSARYDIVKDNPLSNIVNPYLQTPLRLVINGSKFVFITCDIRQVIYETIYKKIISNNILENKTIDFEFEKQLACFDVLVKENNKETYLTPIMEGLPTSGIENFCTYSYTDSNAIRIKFNRDSYEPAINSDIEIRLQTTEGDSGNFTYKEDIIYSLNSQNNGYNSVSVLIRPITASMNGRDRKSIKDLKQIIPKEILSRGNITNNKDLENYFNMIDDNNKLMFYKRRDNQFERLYYAYMIIKDRDNSIVPTNTINLKLNKSDLIEHDGRYILNPGRTIKYDSNIGVIDNDLEYNDIIVNEQKGFIYSSPFITIINKYPLSVSYYLDVLNRYYEFEYVYINQNSELQFISNFMKCEKNYINDRKYILSMTLTQNINIDKNLITIDDNGISDCKIRPVIVFTQNNFKYYKFGMVVDYNKSTHSYDVEFELETDNIINKDNLIKIKNLIPQGSTTPSDIFLSEKVSCEVMIFLEKDETMPQNVNNQEIVIPDMEMYALVNKYKTFENLHLFYNYSNTINSKVSVSQDGTFLVKGVPLIKYSYINDLDRCNEFIDYIQYRKAYIDSALESLENSFNVDLKFFNTYGPSKMFRIGHNKECLDKVNLSFNFMLKLLPSASSYIIDNIHQEIKEYIEDLNKDEITNIHMSNLITYLTNKFSNDIKFIEFKGINNYNSLFQYLERDEIDLVEDVPEFVNINLTKDLKPDINIVLV